MSRSRDVSTLGQACQIKPPKKEAKEHLSATDLVSFVPMNDLGIREKELNATKKRPLGEVSGSYTYFADGDVLLAKITPCFENGKLGIARGLVNGVGFGSSEFIVFRPKKSLDPEYLFYFLSQDSFRDAGASVMSGAVGHKRVPKEFVEGYPISLPPFPEQKRIVAILDEAFAGIDTAVANTEKNLANARELFESCLNSRMTRFEGEYVLDELKNVSGFQGGSQPPKSAFINEPRDGYIRLLQIRDFKSDDKAVFVPASKKNRVCDSSDIMIGRYGASVGQIHTGKSGAYNVALIKTIPDKQKISRRYFYYYLLSDVFQNPLASVASRSAQAGFSKDDIARFPVPLPPLSEQESIAELLDDWREEIMKLEDSYVRKLSSLAELKQSLLQKAFSGELTAGVQDEVETALA